MSGRDAAHIPDLEQFSVEGVIILRMLRGRILHITDLADLDIGIGGSQLRKQLTVVVRKDNVAALHGQLMKRILNTVIRNIVLHQNVYGILHLLLKRNLCAGEVISVRRALITLIDESDRDNVHGFIEMKQAADSIDQSQNRNTGQECRQIYPFHRPHHSFPAALASSFSCSTVLPLCLASSFSCSIVLPPVFS